MGKRKQRRTKRKERVLLKTWAYGVEMRHWGRARAEFVVHNRVY